MDRDRPFELFRAKVRGPVEDQAIDDFLDASALTVGSFFNGRRCSGS
jgi:hypothetical protein